VQHSDRLIDLVFEEISHLAAGRSGSMLDWDRSGIGSEAPAVVAH